MVDLVGTVVEALKGLGVEQGHQKIECVIIVRNYGIEGHLLLPKSVEIHVIVVGDGTDLWQIEGSQADSGGDQDAFRGFARGHLKDLVLPHRHAVRPDLLYGWKSRSRGETSARAV